ncbi:MAG: hypothetical protein ABH881_00220 [bacterium]
MTKINKNIILFSGLSVIILWQMLLPGYVLTMDMIFAPQLLWDNFLNDGVAMSAMPLVYSLKFLNLFLSGWVIQKILLVFLFFFMSYSAFLFLPVSKKYGANYWAALFYTVNPFVYERFLAGQLLLLYGYALMPLFFYYLIKLAKDQKTKDGLALSLCLALIGVFSSHFLIIAALISVVYLLFSFIKYLYLKDERVWPLARGAFFSAIFFLAVSAYWLVPYFFYHSQSDISSFNEGHWEAFQTCGDQTIGTALNVLALYGFWGECEPWADYFLWSKTYLYFWIFFFVALFGLVASGIFYALRKKEERNTAALFLSVGVAGFILSCGTGDTIFREINLFLFRHIGFWSGFRDTQKWSALLVLAYAYFGSIGVVAIVERVKNINFQKYIIIILFLIPALYTYTMWGGFARQLHSVWYPDSWIEVNEILIQDQDDFKILFLPWHSYFSLDFNQKLITANPAREFFGKKIIQADNVELGSVYRQGNNVENKTIESLVLNEEMTADEITTEMDEKDIKYIIIIPSTLKEDFFKYNFLNSQYLEVIYDQGDLKLFRIVI